MLGAGVGVGREAAQARASATHLPVQTPARIAFMRLWPIGAFALLVGVADGSGPRWRRSGAGYAILIALAWRGRERAVTAIEARDGVRFYVEPSNAFEPVRLLHPGPLPRPGPDGEAAATARRGRLGAPRCARAPLGGR